MKRFLLTVIATLVSLPLFATNYHPQPITTGTCSPHDTYGHPSSGDIFLCRDAFAIGFDSAHRIPAWSVYKMTRTSVNQQCHSQPGFRFDPYLPKTIQANNHDYSHNHWDKGHMAPRATADITCKAEKQSVYYTNAAPQHFRLNRFGWRILEEEIRELADSLGDDPIYVVTGAIYSGQHKMKSHVTIPEKFYKVIYVPSHGQSVAFVFDNKPLGTKKTALAHGARSMSSFEAEFSIRPLNIPDAHKTQIGSLLKRLYQEF